jgi:hypothetical protein
MNIWPETTRNPAHLLRHPHDANGGHDGLRQGRLSFDSPGVSGIDQSDRGGGKWLLAHRKAY